VLELTNVEEMSSLITAFYINRLYYRVFLCQQYVAGANHLSLSYVMSLLHACVHLAQLIIAIIFRLSQATNCFRI